MTNQEESHDKNEKIKVPDDVPVAVPPDGGYGWVVLVAAFVSFQLLIISMLFYDYLYLFIYLFVFSFILVCQFYN